jgi:SAM-dependent methyltransferase
MSLLKSKAPVESLVYHRDTCRLCDSPDVELVLKMAPCPPVDAYISADHLKDPQPLFPMDLYLCRACGHGQLLDVVSPKLLFGSYIYTTSSSPGLVEYFREYAAKVYDQVKPPKNGLAVDIGSNDGTLLSFFKKRDLRVLGVDPAREIAQAATAAGIETVPEFFNSKVAARLRAERGPANLITANNVFAHSDQLGDMADGIRSLLAPDGVFVFEVSYLLDMIENMVFDFIYHEHLSHHSIKPLQTFLARHGLHLFAVERTPSKGGTIRCFAQPKGGPRPESPSVSELIKLEGTFGLYRLETYEVYSGRIARAKQQVQDLVKKLRSEGKTIAGYGASATGTVLTYHFELGDSMSFIIDDNTVRQNRFSPGHHIPVVSSRALVEKKPDYVIILVWRFADMIIQKNQAYLQQGGHFIVPLPELQVI